MLLGMSRRAVELLREEQPKHSPSSESEASDDDDDYDRGFKTQQTVRVTGEKRAIGEISDPFGVLAARAKRQQLSQAQNNDVKVEVSDKLEVKEERDTSPSASNVLRQLPPAANHTAVKKEQAPDSDTCSSKPTRVYFQFVCNLVDHYPIVDENNSHIGHFDFDPETEFTTAEGVYHLSQLFRDPQPLSIYKVASEPDLQANRPGDWYDYDGRKWGSF